MRKPCGTRECAEYVERCGGDPSSPSDYICWGCGGEGPMRRYFDQQLANGDGSDDEE
jgi:hypothetical protein